ncbi:hypothetical protein KKF84_09945 [Myxococcota bacterium]|nr:hypothetical protein [Myxococcota bacterium]MBU1535632.1 hypothetical protein [Myxococcota bacterium]
MAYTPYLSIFTALFEIAAGIWVIRGTGNKKVTVPAALILFFLAGYQVLEWFVCRNTSADFLSRLAFADVVWLPPLGVLLIHNLSGSTKKWTRWGTLSLFGGAGILTAAVLFIPTFITQTVCTVVFATYYTDTPMIYLSYALYYNLGLLVIVFAGVYTLSHTRNDKYRPLVGDFLTGNLAFILGALATMAFFSPTRGATPSIMCHFALLLALFTVRMVMRLHALEAEGSRGAEAIPGAAQINARS